MDELKRHVEAIVAPIPAEEVLKNKYRQELYAHALQRYRSERDDGADREPALRAAIDRLGEPKTLRAEFLAALGPLDRVFGYIEYWTDLRRGETIGRYVLRAAGIVVGLVVVPIFFLLVTGLGLARSTPGDVVSATYALGLLVAWSVFVLVTILGCVKRYAERIQERPESRFGRQLLLIRGAILAAAACWFANAAGWYLIHSALLAAFDGSHAANALMAQLRADFGILYWGILTVLTLAMPWALAWDMRRRGDIPDWPYA